MPPPFIPVTGDELKRFRTERSIPLQELAEMLRVKSASTVSAWENGQDIPGPSQVLLALLIRGEMPFTSENVASPLRESMWELEMSLGTWEEINRRRIAGGYATVTDWIASLVRHELGQRDAAAPDPLPDWRTGPGGVSGVQQRMVADEGTEYLTDARAAADAAATGAAEAWLAAQQRQTPAAPPPGAAGSEAHGNGEVPEDLTPPASRKRRGSAGGNEGRQSD